MLCLCVRCCIYPFQRVAPLSILSEAKYLLSYVVIRMWLCRENLVNIAIEHLLSHSVRHMDDEQIFPPKTQCTESIIILFFCAKSHIRRFIKDHSVCLVACVCTWTTSLQLSLIEAVIAFELIWKEGNLSKNSDRKGTALMLMIND